jgi:regulator of protease activity HflC (stomatin/prohibitin superfamily)
MREQVVSFPPQPVITADNLVVSIDTVLYFKVVDPVRATYEIANFLQAIEQLTVTTLRNVIGSMDMERALTSRGNEAAGKTQARRTAMDTYSFQSLATQSITPSLQ